MLEGRERYVNREMADNGLAHVWELVEALLLASASSVCVPACTLCCAVMCCALTVPLPPLSSHMWLYELCQCDQKPQRLPPPHNCVVLECSWDTFLSTTSCPEQTPPPSPAAGRYLSAARMSLR